MNEEKRIKKLIAKLTLGLCKGYTEATVIALVRHLFRVWVMRPGSRCSCRTVVAIRHSSWHENTENSWLQPGKRPEIGTIFTTLQVKVPQKRLKIDKEKVEKLD